MHFEFSNSSASFFSSGSCFSTCFFNRFQLLFCCILLCWFLSMRELCPWGSSNYPLVLFIYPCLQFTKLSLILQVERCYKTVIYFLLLPLLPEILTETLFKKYSERDIVHSSRKKYVDEHTNISLQREMQIQGICQGKSTDQMAGILDNIGSPRLTIIL